MLKLFITYSVDVMKGLDQVNKEILFDAFMEQNEVKMIRVPMHFSPRLSKYTEK